MDFSRDESAQDKFAKDKFAKDNSPDPKAGSDANGEGLEGSAEQISASAAANHPGAAADADRAGASQDPTNGPVTGELIGPDMNREARPSARGAGAKARQGSALILIPPVMRNADEPQGGAHFSAKGRDFNAERGAFLPNGWVRYAAPVALGFCLFGFGVATGFQFFHGSTPAAQTGGTAAIPMANTDQIAMLHLSKKLGEEIHALQSRVDALRLAVRSQTPEDLRGVKKGLDGLKARFETAKVQTDASIAQVTAKLDRLQRQEAMLTKPSEKASHAEKSAGAPATTGSIARATARGTTVATALAPPALARGTARPLGGATEAKKRPKLLADWVIRDVYQGVALVDGPNGTIEVARGESIPGAGRVEAIERKNGGWIIVTNRGIVGSLRD